MAFVRGLLLRYVSMSLAIGLTSSISVSNNGEGSSSMWVFHFLAFYDFFFFCLHSKQEFHLFFNSICTLAPTLFDILNFVDIFFPLSCKSSMMGSGRTCPLAIWYKLCITSSYSNWENGALVCTQRHSMIMFVLSNNLHCIDNTCKVVHLVMDPKRMNCCWRGHKD